MAAYIDHAAYQVEDLDWYIRFFHEVYEMDVYRTVEAEGLRKVWLVGGVQLCEKKAPCVLDGRADHLCLIVDDLEAARTKALGFGCSEMPKHHWIKLPDGMQIEMFQALPGAVQTLREVPKH